MSVTESTPGRRNYTSAMDPDAARLAMQAQELGAVDFRSPFSTREARDFLDRYEVRILDGGRVLRVSCEEGDVVTFSARKLRAFARSGTLDADVRDGIRRLARHSPNGLLWGRKFALLTVARARQLR